MSDRDDFANTTYLQVESKNENQAYFQNIYGFIHYIDHVRMFTKAIY